MRFRAVFRKNKTRWYTEEVANNTARPIPMGARRFAHEWLFALHRAGDPRLVISSYAWWLAPYEEYLMEIPWLLGLLCAVVHIHAPQDRLHHLPPPGTPRAAKS